MLNGWVNINKPQGMSSMTVIRALRRITGTKKMGHVGTLDPMASGVLPVAIGEATKTIPYYQNEKRKTYQFVLVLGEKRDTDDSEGRVLQETDVIPTQHDIETILPQFTGDIWQVPPAYSAVKINGKRAYKLARKGDEVKIDKRQAYIENISLVEALNEKEFLFEVKSAPGVYMRALARDIAECLGSYGHARDIKRLADGPFHIDHSVCLEKLNEQGWSDEYLLQPQYVLKGFDQIQLENEAEVEALKNGKELTLQKKSSKLYKNEDFTEEIIYATYVEDLIAICMMHEGVLKPKKVFHIID